MPFDFGDVVLAPFPFTNQAAFKQRLAIASALPEWMRTNCSGRARIGHSSRPTMNETDYQSYYEQLTDDQLRLVLADKQDLVPEAVAALDREVQRRKLGPAEPPQWNPLADTNQPVRCLDDYPEYRELTAKRRKANKYAIPIALAPFLLGLVFARRAVENSDAFVLLTLAWCLVVVFYAWSLTIRWFRFRCPQCGESFGRGKECFSCGFPRSAPTDKK
jgi:hypothetical protein